MRAEGGGGEGGDHVFDLMRANFHTCAHVHFRESLEVAASVRLYHVGYELTLSPYVLDPSTPHPHPLHPHPYPHHARVHFRSM